MDKLIRSISFLLFLLASADSASAQLLGGVRGPASADIRAGCTGCCFAKNLGSHKVRVTLVLTLGATSALDLQPGEGFNFTIGNECLKGGYYMLAVYLDQQSRKNGPIVPSTPPPSPLSQYETKLIAQHGAITQKLVGVSDNKNACVINVYEDGYKWSEVYCVPPQGSFR